MVRKIVYTLILIFLLFAFLRQSSCKIPYEYVNPKPPFYKQTSYHVCASTACAMVMGYWADSRVGIVNDLGEEGYKEAFKVFFGTTDGEAFLDQHLFESRYCQI